MNEHEMAPLPDDVATALATERAREGVSEDVRARLRARLRASLPAGDIPHDTASPSRVEPGVSRRLLRRLRALHPALTAGTGFVIGVTAGMAVQARLDRAQVHLPEPAPVVHSAAPPPERVIPSTAPTPSVVPSPTEPSPSREAHAEAPAPSAPTLTAERALLDIAHTELAKGEAGAALDGLNRHAQRFPRGVYREEREALIIQSLRALGRTDEALSRAAAFKTRYPKSLFLSIVDPANP